MSDFDLHLQKYKMFRADARNVSNSVPTRIEAYFYAAFRLIEAKSAQFGIHIQKHQKVRTILEENPVIFREYTEQAWRSFNEIENQIRPGQIYGGAINGKRLARTMELFDTIEAARSEIAE